MRALSSFLAVVLAIVALAAARGAPALVGPAIAPPTGAAAPPADIEAWTLDWWQHQQLPAPAPRIEPGGMLVGLAAFLEARAPSTTTLGEPGTPFGALVVEATGSFSVDWGDGTVTGPYRDAGAPWPDGTIRHTYQRAGRYLVDVRETWTATWRIATQFGALPAVTTSGLIVDFPVRQVQAIGQ